MKTRYRILIIAILLIILFRGSIFRLLISYEATTTHPITEIENRDFLQSLSQVETSNNIESLIQTALLLTSNQLHFRSVAVSTNPNELFQASSVATHCVGYADYFGAIFQQLLRQQNWEDKYEVQHTRGTLQLFGFDLHRLSDDPFFRDHDYNVVLEKATGNRWIIDAAVFDYLGIKTVE